MGSLETSSPTDSQAYRIAVDHEMIGEKVFEMEKLFLSKMAEIKDQPVVLDLLAVKQIDSRGIALCIGLFKECKAKGVAFSVDASSDLYRYLKMLKLTKVIEIREGKTV
jgi:anti-anti-sigma factor